MVPDLQCTASSVRQRNTCVAAAQRVIVCVGIRAGHSTKIRSQSASVHLPAAQSAFGRALRVRSPGNLDCIRIRSHRQESSGFGCNHAPALQRGRSHHHVPTLFDQLRSLVSYTVVAHPGHRYLQTRSRCVSFASAAQRPAAHRLRGGALEQRVHSLEEYIPCTRPSLSCCSDKESGSRARQGRACDQI